MEYRETKPCQALRGVVRCVWTLRGPGAGPGAGAGAVERVLPDGHPEIIINRADPFARVLDGGVERAQASVLLVGQLGGAMRLVPRGAIDLVGVRFEPAGLHALLGLPMRDVADTDVELADVHGVLARRLREASAETDGGRLVRAVEGALLGLLDGAGDRLRFGHAAWRHIERGRFTTTRELAASMRVTARTLERVFREEIGLTPKRFMRVRRLARVVTRLDSGRRVTDWSALAQTHGFADQPHLIREFRLLAGVTPRGYLREQTAMMDHFAGSDESRFSNPAIG